MVNCPQCGAPNAEDVDSCLRCDTLLPKKSDTQPDSFGDARTTPLPQAMTAPEEAGKTTPPPPGSVPPATTPEPPSRELLDGRYELIRILGEGGMGVVYEALDRELDEKLAVKLLQRQFTVAPADIERFKREIKTARRISHPNVIRIYHFGVARGEAYICMELLPGGSLAERIANEPIPIDEGLRICTGVARGLGAAHRLGVIHRDIKPHNVMFDAGGNVKILDFGIARFSAGTSHTQGFVGTPHYISPEQADGGSASKASDVYSLGVLMYEVFAGRTPFLSDSLAQLILMHVSRPPEDPRHIRPALPDSIADVILRCLAKKPGERYPDGNAVAEALEAIDLSAGDWQRESTHHFESMPRSRLLGDRYEIVGPSPKSLPGRLPGRDLDSRRDVTIRLIPQALVDSIDDIEVVKGRLLRIKAIEHPNICPVEDLVVSDDGMAIVTQRLDGESLESRIAEMGQLPVGWALRILQDIARGLAAAHEAGITHGHLDASRVVLNRRTDEAVVLDFGLGSIDAEAADPRADVYALGLLAIQLTTGHRPKPEEAAAAVDALPSEIARLASVCLDSDPSHRPADGAAVLKLMEARDTGSGAAHRPTSGGPGTWGWLRQPAGQIGAVAVVLVLAVAAWLGVRAVRRASRRTPPRLEANVVGLYRITPYHLEENQVWLAEALEKLIAEELDDAYGLKLQILPAPESYDNSHEPPGSFLTVGDTNRLEAKIVLQRGNGPPQSYAGVAFPMRQFVITKVGKAAEDLFQQEELAPSGAQLTADGARDPEAWRNWRRAQRASMLGKWTMAVRLGELTESDPGFPLGLLEASFAYDDMLHTKDRLFQSAQRRAGERKNLNPFWARAIAIAELAQHIGDADTPEEREQRALTVQRSFDEALASPTRTYRQELWARSHWLTKLVDDDDPSAEPFAADFEERFPGEAAPPVHLIDYYLSSADPRNLEPYDIDQALKYTKLGLERAPQDVGVRARRARALILKAYRTADASERKKLLKESEVLTAEISAADNAEKREVALELFLLHMTRRDTAAARNAIVLATNGPAWQPGQAKEGLGLLECWKGDYRECMDKLNKAVTIYLAETASSSAGRDQHAIAWLAYKTGRYETCAGAFRNYGLFYDGNVLKPTASRIAAEQIRPDMSLVLAALCDDLEAARRAGKPLHTAERARRQLQAQPPAPRSGPRLTADMLIAFEEGRMDDVLKYTQALSGKASDSLGVTWWAGRAHEEQGRLDLARTDYRTLIEHPGAWMYPVYSAESLYRLGVVSEKLADDSADPEEAARLRKEAMAAYRTYVEERTVESGETAHRTDARQRLERLTAHARTP